MSTEKDKPFRLPPPKFSDETKKSLDNFTKLRNPHFSTPSGMLLPREKQPPPMYGPRGSTVPPRFLAQQQQKRYRHSTDRGRYQHRFLKDPQQGNRNQYFDSEVIPELLEINWSLWCEGCDVNCKTDEELRKHCEGHRECAVAGCRYVGHPKVMKRHWRLAHDEEKLREKAYMQTKQSPEEISDWREERKKRFPTKANIELRQRAQEERFKRGERIEENKNRFPERSPAERNRSQFSTRRGRGRFEPRSRRPRVPDKESEAIQDSDDEENVSRVAFKGTSKLKNYKEKPKNALSLLGQYGSDSECESDTDSKCSANSLESEGSSIIVENTVESTEEVPIIHNPESIPLNDESDTISEGEIVTKIPDNTAESIEKIPVIHNPESIPINDETDTLSEGEIVSSTSEDDEEKVDISDQPSTIIEKEPDNPEQTGSKSRHRSRRRRNGKSSEVQGDGPTTSKVARVEQQPILNYQKFRRIRQNTMLEKLLEPDIRHERNVLLQCVRFVVENNFFGIGQPKLNENNR
ncbi:FMR1-interacting protein NUFIP1 [Malaya genurostris]|uniref:FMR1-interacting protein NUFIP1 n=1 Tax=Malaya genurostris TaxID=325434 RepID=UPI0026F37FBC|nr:FMR1-interacting protein NUFIP1 [Malaya genurostris]XP_058453947.1 FMR1-interacting protein NUFIP1 [Malaya genurostris]